VSSGLWKDLAAGDIVFVDSSHVFKSGSDVEYEFWHVYPQLASGVFIHIHDIFFPNDYPIEWNLKDSRFWNEQNVLAAVLANSDRYEVVVCDSALHAAGLVAPLFPSFRGDYSPGSIWLRVN